MRLPERHRNQQQSVRLLLAGRREPPQDKPRNRWSLWRISVTLFIATLLCGGAFSFSDSAGVDKALLERLTTNLMCTCGCPHQIKQCGDECGVAPQLIADLEKLVAGGMSEQQIYARYEAQYGPVIYAAPRKQGFDLMAWVLPFLALGVGALIVVVAVRKLRPAQAGSSAQSAGQAREIDEKYRKLLEKELAE